MRRNAEQMVPYMWRRPSLICAFMLGESESMDDWYLTRQLADYLRQTLRDGVCVETETNRYLRCVNSVAIKAAEKHDVPVFVHSEEMKWGEKAFSTVEELNAERETKF